MQAREISLPTLRRLPVYLHYLTSIREERKNISATAIAAYFGINDVQVRKDLGVVSGTGRPSPGSGGEERMAQRRGGLSCTRVKIVAAVDTDSRLMGSYINGKPIYSVSELERVCKKENASLGIIAVPVAYAQTICDKLVFSGIKAIWNFAPAILKKPEGVLIENENLASSLAILSRHLGESANE